MASQSFLVVFFDLLFRPSLTITLDCTDLKVPILSKERLQLRYNETLQVTLDLGA